jgi:hypothetical protein
VMADHARSKYRDDVYSRKSTWPAASVRFMGKTSC